MDKLYTGGGDKGYTSTLSQRRISKSDILIDLLGTVDELEAALGVAKTFMSDKKLIKDTEAIQKKLFGIMEELSGGKQSVTAECVATVENMCDSYMTECDGFVISGHNSVEAHLNMARVIARRAERLIVKSSQLGRVKPDTLVWFNRISDLIYAMARYSAKERQLPKVEAGEYAADKMSLSLAKELSLAVEKYAVTVGVKPVVAVVDAGGNLVLLHSADDSYIASRKIAKDKAYTAVSLKMPTAVALKESRGGALDGLCAGDGICLLGGGEPLIANGQIIGGIGVSGGSAEQDTLLGHFAAEYLLRRQTL